MSRKSTLLTMGGGKFLKFALFPLILLMLLLLPTRMVAQTDYDTSVTFKALEGNPEGVFSWKDYYLEEYNNLFDGNKKRKWCDNFKGSAYVIFEASKAGAPVGYTITTGNDNESDGKGRNPLSWKLYGNNEGKDGAWTLIQEVSNDTKLQDVNCASYDFTCECYTSYKYFKWEITAIHSGGMFQVGEFELKLNTCSHKKDDGLSALGEAIETVETTCTEYGYTIHECSICHSKVKVDKNDELKKHTLTHHAQKNATCTEAGIKEYWQCCVCNKLFSDADATTEITDAASLEIPAKGHQYNSKGTCTACGATEPRYALFNSLDGITNVKIKDYEHYPWKMLDLNASNMSGVLSYFTEKSTGLMSSNTCTTTRKGTISYSDIYFTVKKPILLTFKLLISAGGGNNVTVTLYNNYVNEKIYGKNQIEVKFLLPIGRYALRLQYTKSTIIAYNDDRAFIYDLKTTTTFSEYVADYDATNATLTYKNITPDNLGSLHPKNIVIGNNKGRVNNICGSLEIESTAIKKIVFEENFKTYAPTSLKSLFESCTKLETISGREYLNTANVTDMSYMFKDCSALTSLDLTNFNTANVTDMSNMFNGCSALTSLDLTKFKTENVTDMTYMFNGCSALTSLDLTKFNTEKVTNMSYMFAGCNTLSSLDLTKFNTENVTDMTYMFNGCSALTSLDLTKFKTENVTDMKYMFNDCSALTSLDLTNFNAENVTDMFRMFSGCSALTSLNLTNFNAENVRSMEFMFNGCSALTSLNLTNFNSATVLYMGYMFNGCSALTSLDLTNFNTANVRYMNYMFNGCSALTSLDITSFNTAKVMDMSSMFSECSSLTGIFASDKFVTDKVTKGSNMFIDCDKLIGAIGYDGNKTDHNYANYETGYFSRPAYAEFDESTGTLTFKCGTSIPEGTYMLNVGKSYPKWYDQRNNIKNVVFDASLANTRATNCYAWFYGCNNLTTIEGIEYLNTENVTDMGYMFYGCSALTSLNLTNFNTKNVTDMNNMFYDCRALTSLNLTNFNTENVTDMKYMFSKCNKLTSLDVSKFDTQNVTDMNNMFYDCRALISLNLTNFNTENVTDMKYMFFKCNKLTSLDLCKFDTQNVTDMSYMFYYCFDLTSLDVSKFDTQNVTDMSYMFGGCFALTSLDVSKFDTQNVTNMSCMFSTCKELTSLNFTMFDTQNVTDMSSMFTGCQKLTSLDVSKFDTQNVTDMSWMFNNCNKLTSLDLKNFNTENVTNMRNMFSKCNKLTSLDLKNFNTKKVTDMNNMFYECRALTSLNLTNFNTENVTDMNRMFYNCYKLTSLDVSKFDTQNVTDMSWMFYCCYKLTSLDLTKFNTEKVTNMSNMFAGCNTLSSLDLTNFNTAIVSDMSSMFRNCSTLTTIFASNKFVTGQDTDGRYMFYGCKNLKGAIDKYYENKIDHTYANYKTGYFTKLVVRNGNERYGITGETTQLTVDNLALADDKDFVAYEPFAAKAASYSRTIKTGTTWATLCLPFEVSLDNQNFRAFKLLSADDVTETVELEELKTSIAAGTPVIIKMKEGATELNFSVADKIIAKDVQTAETANSNYQLQGLYTQKVFSKDADNNCYIVKGDKLMNPAKLLENKNVKKVVSKPFRAYMLDNSSAPASGAKMFSIGFDDSITTIDTINTIANDKAEYYDLQGKRLNEPQKGINIVKRGGKTMKVIIK